LTSPSSSTVDWDIIRALRIHALERSGKVKESLILLWELLVSNVVLPIDDKRKVKDVWSELYQKIVSLSDVEDVINNNNNDKSSSGLDIQLMDAVQRLDVRAFTPIQLPTPSSNTAATTSTQASASSKPAATKSKSKKGKSKSKKSTSSSTTPSTTSTTNINLPPITDETVLSTISVTLRTLNMSDTISYMYYIAVETLSSADNGMNKEGKSREEMENYASVLEESVVVHLKAVCDYSNVTTDLEETNDSSDDTSSVSYERTVQCGLSKLEVALRLTKYYERMQSCKFCLCVFILGSYLFSIGLISCFCFYLLIASLQLAKLTSQPLHFQWTAISSLWYRESLVELVAILEEIQKSLLVLEEKKVEGTQAEAVKHLQDSFLKLMGLSNLSDIATHIAKLQQKTALLPKLAESLSSRMVQQDPSSDKVVSESDWDVYLETLLVQDKKNEALEVLKNIQCTSMIAGSNNGSEGSNVLPQINDEDTINNRVGSMMPYTQRKKLERMAKLSLEIGMFDQAEGYYRELLDVFPDQWTYWLGLIYSCVKIEKDKINKEGWVKCQSYANEIIVKVEGSQKYALRGPYLVLLELASMKVADTSEYSYSTGTKEELVTVLREEICKYGNKFGSIASCCFEDVRPYLNVVVQASGNVGDVDASLELENTMHILTWAKDLWKNNSQAAEEELNGEVSAGEFRERRKKIRSYIFAVHVIYYIASRVESKTMYLLQMFAPDVSRMVTEWKTSLSSLPGVAPKDGGQKEVLPGDEIILLTSQYLQYQATKSATDSSLLLQAAAVLEEAMDHSPYNPHLKIAAIGVYIQLNAAHRALAIYQDMGIKQIQLDSCSYLILPTLIQGGLYSSVIKLASSIMRLHGSTSKDIKVYASKALRNGLMLKAKEMVTFQRDKMRPSLQLLYSKGIVMDAVPLMNPSDMSSDDLVATVAKQRGSGKPPPQVKLAQEKGFGGNEEDLIRAEQIAIDAEVHFNAPSVIHTTSQCVSVGDFISSDNRDISINYFQILHQNTHLSKKDVVVQSLRRGHIHGLMTRAIMAVGAANAPKKGKVPKPTDETTYLCQSLLHSLSSARKFSQEVGMNDIDLPLWDVCCQLCEVVVSVVQGDSTADSDTLADREKTVTSIIESTTKHLENARKAFSLYYPDSNAQRGARVCQLLPDHIIPVYVLLETATRLFALFGWGKRKRLTKDASKALANLALSFSDFISELLVCMSKYRSFGEDNSTELVKSVASVVFDTDMIQRVINEVVSSRDMSKDRVDPFLLQMKESLETYNEEIQ